MSRELGVAIGVIGLLGLLGGVGWLFLAGNSTDDVVEEVSTLDSPGPAEPEKTIDKMDVDGAASAVREEVDVVPPLIVNQAPVAPQSYLEALAGIRGRIVEEDGTPVAGMKVELYEAKAATILRGFQTAFLEELEEPPPLAVGDAITKKDGTFEMKGAKTRAFHALGIDLEGPRATMRILDSGLEPGEHTDLGDIVLAPFVTFIGQVRNEDGEPVPHARVRATMLPPMIMNFGLQDIREDTRVIISTPFGPDKQVLDPPSWAMALVKKLPLPTTEADEQGNFRLEGVPQGMVTIVADRPGYLGGLKGPQPTGRGPERDIGVVPLSNGRTISGRVVDINGDPISGVEICAGVASIQEFGALAQPSLRTDSNGYFEVRGIAPFGNVLVAARQSTIDPWTVIGPQEEYEDIVVELPASLSLTVLLRDLEDKVIPTADLRIRPQGIFDELSFATALSPFRPTPGRIKKLEDGKYEISNLKPGNYVVVGRAEHHAVAHALMNLSPDSEPQTLTFRPGFPLTVHVLNGETREPVDHAMVSAIDDRHNVVIEEGRSNAEGVITLGPLAASDSGNLPIRASHPGFGIGYVVLEGAALSSPPDSVEILMPAGTVLNGRIHFAGRAMEEHYMILLEARGSHEHPDDEIPRLAVTDAEGNFTFHMLAAGDYRWEVVKRFLFQDPNEFFAAGDFMDIDTERRGRIELRLDEDNFLDIDLSPDALGPTATLRGMISGPPGAQYMLNLYADENYSIRVNANELYEKQGIIADRYSFQVYAIQDQDGGQSWNSLYYDNLELQPNEVREFNLDLQFAKVEIIVLDSFGSPVSGANVSMNLMRPPEEGGGHFNPSGATDESGRVFLSLPEEGEYAIHAANPSAGRVRSTVKVPSNGPVQLTLDPGVPCAGTIEYDDPSTQTSTRQNWSYLVFQRRNEDGNYVHEDGVMIQNGNKFNIAGLAAGEYQAELYTNGGQYQPVKFSLGPAGNTNLQFSFQRR